MQSEQTTPPKRIWADPPETFDGMDIWRSEPGGKGVPYILAAPTALASSAEVQALLREARAQGMEEAANIAVRHDLSIMSISSADMRARQIAQAIRTAAAALRAGKGETTCPPDQDPTTIRAQIAAVTIQVTCECGEQLCHEIECEEDDFGGWSAAPEGRFILCEACERLIDAGLQISIGVPA